MPAVDVMDGAVVRLWLRLAADALGRVRSAIDLLNVFPVADSDTGTNLHKTIAGAADALDGLPEQATTSDVWRAATTAALQGACGNSGIIVSQMLYGLADTCGPASPCDGQVVALGLTRAAALATAAVHRPVEGTILTVAEAAAQAAARAAAYAGALPEIGRAAAFGARRALTATPDQLDVLAASGVVDAGGAGLCVILDALSEAVSGCPQQTFAVPTPVHPRVAATMSAAASGFSYEVTFILDAAQDAVAALRDTLDLLGDSLVVSGSHPQWHVHVHVADAGAAIEAGLSAGPLSKITVTYLNGTQGHPPAAEQAVAGGVVAIADGPGLARLLRRAGATVVDSPDLAALDELGRSRRPAVLIAPPGRHAAHWPPGWPVLEIGCAIQSLAALAVHDPQRDPDADLAAMARAVAGMRWGTVIDLEGSGVLQDPGSFQITADGSSTLEDGSSALEDASAPEDGGPAASPGAERYVAQIGRQLAARGADQMRVAAALADQLLTADTEMITLVTGRSAYSGLGTFLASHVAARAPAVEFICYDGGMTSDVLLIGAE
jgi:dihydroxyacetone kinase-like predicted kinase